MKLHLNFFHSFDVEEIIVTYPKEWSKILIFYLQLCLTTLNTAGRLEDKNHKPLQSVVIQMHLQCMFNPFEIEDYLEKLEKHNLISKDETGVYVINNFEEIIGSKKESEKRTARRKSVEEKKSVPYEEIASLFNTLAPSFPKIKDPSKIGSNRKKLIQMLWADVGEDIETVKKLFEAAEKSEFLKGKVNPKFKANFDWIIDTKNYQKVLDGNYDTKKRAKNQAQDKYDVLDGFEAGGE